MTAELDVLTCRADLSRLQLIERNYSVFCRRKKQTAMIRKLFIEALTMSIHRPDLTYARLRIYTRVKMASSDNALPKNL